MRALHLPIVLWMFAAVAGCSTPSDDQPSATFWNGPDRDLRFVSYNLHQNKEGREKLIAEIAQRKPDFLFLQELPEKDVGAFGRELQLASAFSRENHDKPDEGIALLSAHPLRNTKALIDKDGTVFAVMAETQVDGVPFYVACVHLKAAQDPVEAVAAVEPRKKQMDQFIDAWRAAGSPPMVVGGDFNDTANGVVYAAMTEHFYDALRRIDKDDATSGTVVQMRLDYLLCTPHWAALEGGTGRLEASDHRLIWMTARPVRP